MRRNTHLGVQLLERTTRAVRTTLAGASYYERCVRILFDIDEANDSAKKSTASSQGLIRVACPILFGHAFLPSIVASFTREHPEVEIEVVVTERRVNLVEEGFDVAVRIVGSDESSAYVTRKLSGGSLWCVASPTYFAEHKPPRTPEALKNHRCMVHGESRAITWPFRRAAEVRRVDIHGTISMSSLLMLHSAALEGAGVTRVPEVLCAKDVAAGRLIRVLSEWTDERDLRILYTKSRYQSTRVRHFVEAVVAEYKARLAIAR